MAGTNSRSLTSTAKPAKRSAWRQLATLVRRQFALKLKEKSTLAALLLPPVAIALLMGLLKHGPNEPKTLFMIVVVALWFGCSSSVREIVDELPILRRERQRDLKMRSYLGSKLVYLALISGGQAGLLIVTLRLMDAIQGHLFQAWLLGWALTLNGALIGLVISALCSTAEKALYIFPLTMIPQLLFAGLLIPTATIAPFTPILSPTGQLLSVQDFPKTRKMDSILANGISPLMVSRWGLEGLSDLYLHDSNEGNAVREPYTYELLSSVSITLHPNDSADAHAELDRALVGNQNWGIPPSTPPTDGFLEYGAILGCFALLFIGAVDVALNRKERNGSRI